ncbi:hypothetical protein [Salarchaeum sp. JOR-1]|uniref:DUF7504 family protein n=1 Tax=Salarchaeum sp. JOR-1 TaxID=2599399 RepID=UPI001198414C|nr:hypothetical protein [Salarchaeum sp. JOR-1]QDX40969.1 hypothetical protein FQU85_08685 [Salarchaeum sp. JOR-1]
MYRAGRTDGEFEEILERLKEEGSSLLVVGDVPGEAYARASRRMFGDGDHAPRQRVLVVGSSAGSTLPTRVGETRCGDSDTVITHGTNARTAVASASVTPPVTPHEHVPAGDANALGRAVLDRIDAFDGAFEPGELRLGVDTLQPLLDTAGEFQTFRTVDLLSERVRRERGMAHFRLPQPRENRHVRLLEPLFDAVVELRVTDSVEQRWSLRDENVVSEWVSLDA